MRRPFHATVLTHDVASRAGKKTYTVLMGKPAPAKLANFPEVAVWVQVRQRLPTLHRCLRHKSTYRRCEHLQVSNMHVAQRHVRKG